jgi:Flp pilus assembly protein TadD
MTLLASPSVRRSAILAAVCLHACMVLAQPPIQVDPSPGPSLSSEYASEIGPSLSTAESGLRQKLQTEPRSAPTLYALAHVLLRENKPKESLEIYTKAASVQKPNAEQLRSVAMDYALLKMYGDAIHWLQVAHSFDPHDANVLYDLGRCFYTQSQFHEAEEMYIQVLAIAPKSIKAEENLGLTFDMELQLPKAEAALRTAVGWADEGPSDEWPYLNLGAYLIHHNRSAEALPFLEKAVKRNAKDAACHEKLGRALVDSGQTAAGISELQTAAELDSQNPKIHFELGQAFRTVGERDKAAAEFALSRTLYGTHSAE